MTPVPDPNPILYACVARATTILVELPSDKAGAADDDDHDPHSRLAARCLADAPRFHRHYSHTSGGRIYSFLMDDPLVLFAIADEALVERSRVLLLLRRLEDAFSSAVLRRRSSSDALAHLSLQEEFLPVLRRIVMSIASEDEEPPPPRPCAPPPSASYQPSESDEDRRGKDKKSRKGKSKTVISVVDRDIVDSDPGNGGSKSVRKVWRQHVRTIILVDLLICCLLLAVWVSICRGFECITH
ncbi:hypothetical protein Cni_G05961 [Canna indica]|uniref:Longin domain-containing protein n=1 Tax=Canna indica TaxID=4628 RepID=A0AAQ3Q4A8_9LILI|nr:hypothetical protein Cni_G05961 [Canna indica]